MSGGSFNYLFLAWELDQLGEHREDIKRMGTVLEGFGLRGVRALEKTKQVLALMDQVDELAQQLSDVWHDVEWWQSHDYSRDQIEKVLDEFNERNNP